jgi:hypothetical protein
VSIKRILEELENSISTHASCFRGIIFYIIVFIFYTTGFFGLKKDLLLFENFDSSESKILTAFATHDLGITGFEFGPPNNFITGKIHKIFPTVSKKSLNISPPEKHSKIFFSQIFPKHKTHFILVSLQYLKH